MTLEIIGMVIALLLMASSIVAKILTMQLIRRMKFHISSVESEKRRVLNGLKQTKAQKIVAQKQKSVLQRKKFKLEKQKRGLLKEWKEYLGENVHRQKLNEEKRSKLVRPPLAVA